MKRPIIIIAGPTASGKTTLAITLAKRFDGEIINADSRTVYREMDIATAKPKNEEMVAVPHHLFDLRLPDEVLSAGEYKKLAQKKVEEIHRRNKLPFVVGGTGLYIDSLVYDFDFAKAKPDQRERAHINSLTPEELIDKISAIDDTVLANIDSKNKRRLVRTLEILLVNGIVEKRKVKKPDNILYLSLKIPREELYQRINKRVDEMPIEDLINETKNLTAKYPSDIPALSGIGYREIVDYLDGKIALEQALEETKKRTRHYAKRQLTWFKKNQDIVWIRSEKEATAQINSFLLYLKHA